MRLPPAETNKSGIGVFRSFAFLGDPVPPILFQRVHVEAGRGLAGFFVSRCFKKDRRRFSVGSRQRRRHAPPFLRLLGFRERRDVGRAGLELPAM